MYIWIHINIYIYVYVYIHWFIHIYILVYIYIYLFLFIYLCIYKCIFMHTYICIYIYIFIYQCIYVYIFLSGRLRSHADRPIESWVGKRKRLHENGLIGTVVSCKYSPVHIIQHRQEQLTPEGKRMLSNSRKFPSSQGADGLPHHCKLWQFQGTKRPPHMFRFASRHLSGK